MPDWIGINLISWERYVIDKIYEEGVKNLRTYSEKSGKPLWKKSASVIQFTLHAPFYSFLFILLHTLTLPRK